MIADEIDDRFFATDGEFPAFSAAAARRGLGGGHDGRSGGRGPAGATANAAPVSPSQHRADPREHLVDPIERFGVFLLLRQEFLDTGGRVR
jgi:hypothetical protein